MPAIPRSRHPRLDHRASLRPVWHLATRQPQPETGNRDTSVPPHRPPYDSTPIVIRRVRRRRQRLRSNDSIESDPARQHRTLTRALERRVTLDRVLAFIAGNGQASAAAVHEHEPPSGANRVRHRIELLHDRSQQAWFQSEPFGWALASRRADLGVVIEAELTALSRGEERPRPIFVNGRHEYLDHS